ncbi:MAG: type II toxin-antitoxin system death-on-curing family toxin [Microcystaceae cyanobacterium]
MPEFINIDLAIKINERQINKFGGSIGMRDKNLLESALAQPQATFGGKLLHSKIYEQAAAYLFHLTMNHPFIDGNKRTAFAVMDVFLRLNGFRLNLTDQEVYDLVLAVANGELDKTTLTTHLKIVIISN